MKNIKIISIISLLLFLPNIKPQTVAPLEFGNVWVYDLISNLSRIAVLDTIIYFDSIAYNKMFYEDNYGTLNFNFYSRLNEDEYYVLYNKFDSTETPYYKKDAVIGDTWTVGTLVYTIEDTLVTNVFGEPITIKLLLADDGLIYRQEYWTEKFGKLGSQDFGGVLDDLQGCVINGIAYGDTSFTIVSVEDEFGSPSNFYLAQNYPNPFNPTTKIKYTIPTPPVSSPLVKGRTKEGFVTLKVYDVLGNEIATLVNEEKPAGEYEVEFDATGLPSGVYFYQLRAGNFVETKKMVLLK